MHKYNSLHIMYARIMCCRHFIAIISKNIHLTPITRLNLNKFGIVNFSAQTRNVTTNVIIQTTTGTLSGCQKQTVYDNSYYSFERVPYAEPPLGQLRFKAPQPIKKWDGVLDCTKQAQKAIQLNKTTKEIEGSEDCLYLSIYSKKLISDRPLPVLVYIHGGGFETGDSTSFKHAPDYFMMKDVVLVSIAYRLGALGFLSLNDREADVPGNAGIKDQLLALQWLQENIEHFNGDKNNVTLFGESAGAGAVHFLMLAQQAKGLFHKAILLSGTALCRFALQPLKDLPRRLANANGLLNANTASDKEIVEYLRGLPAKDLVRQHLLTQEEILDGCYFLFGPVVEPYETENCILAAKPKELLANAWANEIPVIFSGTSDEGLMLYGYAKLYPEMITVLNERVELMLPWDVRVMNNIETQRKLADHLRKAHFADCALDKESILNYCEYKTFKVFWHPIFDSVKARLSANKFADTYLLRFNYSSPTFNHHRIVFCGKDVEQGAAHADDLSYLFYGQFSWKLKIDSPEFKTIDRMINILTEFAANGNPNIPNIQVDGEHSGCWAPLSSPTEDWKCLNVGDDLRVIDLPEMKKLRIWDKISKHE